MQGTKCEMILRRETPSAVSPSRHPWWTLGTTMTVIRRTIQSSRTSPASSTPRKSGKNSFKSFLTRRQKSLWNRWCWKRSTKTNFLTECKLEYSFSHLWCLTVIWLGHRYSNFGKGRSITSERAKLGRLHENMRFKGDPQDKKYRAMVNSMNTNSGNTHGKLMTTFGTALKRRIGFLLDKKVTVNEKDSDD